MEATLSTCRLLVKRRLSRAQSNFVSAAKHEPALIEWLEASITTEGDEQ